MITKHQQNSGESEWYWLHERTAWSHGEASFMPARPRRSRDHLGAVSVRSKLPPYVPVSPPPVSREASRDLWRSIGPSTMACSNCECRSLSANITADFIFMFRGKRSLYLRLMSGIDETAETAVSEERGVQMTGLNRGPSGNDSPELSAQTRSV